MCAVSMHVCFCVGFLMLTNIGAHICSWVEVECLRDHPMYSITVLFGYSFELTWVQVESL